MWLLRFSACFPFNRLSGIGHHLNKTDKRKAPMRIKNLKPIGLLFCLSYLKINQSLYNSLNFSRICAIIFYNNSAPTYNSNFFADDEGYKKRGNGYDSKL